jgi:predicted ATPase
MPGYILTGAPGSGKTAILRQLEVNGHAVVEEAATDVIALQHALGHPEPWRSPDFVDNILALQVSRQHAAPTDTRGATFFDRSPICTLALSRHLGRAASRHLLEEVNRLATQHLYERTVFFIRNQGSVRATAARRISFEDSLAFERIHELTYRELEFELIDVPAAALPVRVASVERTIERLGDPS